MSEHEQPALFKEEELSKLPITKVIKRDGRIVAFNRGKIVDSIFRAAVDVGGSDRVLAEELSDKVIALMKQIYQSSATPSVEEIQDLIEKVLVGNAHYRTAKAYILYRDEHRRIRERKDAKIVVEDNVPYKVLWRVYSWNVDHGCDTTENIEKTIRDGKFPELVSSAERQYHENIGEAAERILERADKIKLVIVAGPSSSGKTTTTLKIGEKLGLKNLSFVSIGLDNYFKDLEEHPKDEYGDYDFETPEALDLKLINEHLFDLMRGKTIKMPVYDFKTGKRKLNAKEFRLEKNQILLIDSLHGLYPAMTASIPHDNKFKFYIEALCQIKDSRGEFMRWCDLRMLRRMIRDSWHRSYNPMRTVGHWHYVRRSEKRHIVPFINKSDYIFNGSLPYELPLHKKYLFKFFDSILEKYKDDSKKVDAYIRAKRVYDILKEFKTEPDDACVPKNSLMREFIGGSEYHY
ncbi:MAG: ATP cone domain-containing protein [Endomicrobiia bacterium]|nr:ATP cone domain-containing protein [Endomicrobiia bacterium]